LVHYAVIYREDPVNLPTFGSVPDNIASIFKEVVWETVLNDPWTGVNEVVTTIRNNESSNNWRIYPNPVNSLVKIDLSEDTKGEISVYNSYGVKLREMALPAQSFTLDIGDLPSGVYSFIVTDDNHRKSIQKVVKQ